MSRKHNLDIDRLCVCGGGGGGGGVSTIKVHQPDQRYIIIIRINRNLKQNEAHRARAESTHK